MSHFKYFFFISLFLVGTASVAYATAEEGSDDGPGDIQSSPQYQSGIRDLFLRGNELVFSAANNTDPRAIRNVTETAIETIYQAGKKVLPAKEIGPQDQMFKHVQLQYDTGAIRKAEYSAVTFNVGKGKLTKGAYVQVLLIFNSSKKDKEYRIVLEANAHTLEGTPANCIEEAATALKYQDFKVIQQREVDSSEDLNDLEREVDNEIFAKLTWA